MSVGAKDNLTMILMNIPGAGGTAWLFMTTDFLMKVFLFVLTATVQGITLYKLLKKKK